MFTRRQRFLLCSSLALLAALAVGCNDDSVFESGNAFAGEWLVSRNLGNLNPCFVGLLVPSEPIRTESDGTVVVLAAIDAVDECRTVTLFIVGDQIVFDGQLELACPTPITPDCRIEGDVSLEMTFSNDAFVGTTSGQMTAVPGTGCQFQTFNFSREVGGQRCSGCWPGCTP